MNILLVGLSGVPKRSRACDIRLTFFANLLVKNNSVIILNRYSSCGTLKIKNTKLDEKIKVVDILPPKNTNKIWSIVLFLLSILYEPIKIIEFNRKRRIDVIHVYSGHYFDFLYYFIISRIIKSKVIYQYVEYRTAFKPRGLYHKINSYLCDYWGMKLFDGVLPISNYLEEKVKCVNSNVPTLKLPPICDFDLFANTKIGIKKDFSYLLFCASLEYLEVIEFVVNSFNKSLISKDKKLVLILSGNINEIKRLRNKWQECIILTQLPYDELISYFKEAYALFIPLRPIVSDIARFPNKICEYLASEGVIITTNVGEVSYYFKDALNAIVAREYTENSMVDCLDKLQNGKYNYEVIRKNGYELGKQLFDADSYVDDIQSFLEKL